MEEMTRWLGRFLRKRGLVLNVEKSKILVFRKSRETRKDKVWQWEGKEIEKRILLLGFQIAKKWQREETCDREN